MEEEELDKIAAWLWEQGIERETRTLIVRKHKVNAHERETAILVGSMDDRMLNETMGVVRMKDLHRESCGCQYAAT